MKSAALFLFALMLACTSRAQQNSQLRGLVNEEANVIENGQHLDDFFELLKQQEKDGGKVISIIHLGDSHIQADYLTAPVRRAFQNRFGNAGRGLVVPGRVAGTNEPANFRSSSEVKWLAKRIIYPDQPLPIGIGGITVQSSLPNARLSVVMQDATMDYSFNTVKLFFQKDVHSCNYAVLDSAGAVLTMIHRDSAPAFEHYAVAKLDAQQSQLRLQSIHDDSSAHHATIFGFSLENERPGILYHAIGVNGAKYSHYNTASQFPRQTGLLKPDLFIISLGTNESLEYPYTDARLHTHIDKLITSLRAYNPLAKFILVTPPDAFRRKIKPNPGIARVRKIILDYAVENGLAFYDMYKALGGSGSALKWKNAGLLRADGIHFTKDGYAFQGDLLFAAFMKSYQTYVDSRL